MTSKATNGPLLVTIMSEPNVGTSGCLVKETTRLLEGLWGKKFFFYCFLREKKCVELVSYIEDGTDHWRGRSCNSSVLVFSLGRLRRYLHQNDEDK